MRIFFIAFLALGICSVNYASSMTPIRCDSTSNVSLVYNPSNNSTEIIETNDPVKTITLDLDSGFLKLSEQQSNDNTLFRQNSIRNNGEDPLNLTVRYETASKSDIKKISIIISDPMCKANGMSLISVFETAEHSYISTKYRCDCLSSVHDSNHFIRVR
jgi:hypothetical protein